MSVIVPTLAAVKPQRSGQVYKGPESTGGKLEAAGAPSSEHLLDHRAGHMGGLRGPWGPSQTLPLRTTCSHVRASSKEAAL